MLNCLVVLSKAECDIFQPGFDKIYIMLYTRSIYSFVGVANGFISFSNIYLLTFS